MSPRHSITTLAVLAALGLGAAGVARADDAAADRQERMNRAYEDYRNPNPGPAARTENAIKRGAHRTASAVRHGAEKTGHAIGTGVRKTGDAIRRGGEKLQEKTER